MIINFNDKKKWNLPLIAQFEAYEYSPYLCCIDCSTNNNRYDWMDGARKDIIGYCEVNGELQVCCECHICGSKYRFHLSKYWKEDYSFDVERWQDEVALQFYLNQDIYKKFEIEDNEESVNIEAKTDSLIQK